MVKNLPATAGDVRDTDPIPGWGRSPGGGHGNPCSGRWSLNHWTAQEVPGTDFSAASSGLGNKASQQRARRNQGMRRGETPHVPIASSEGNEMIGYLLLELIKEAYPVKMGFTGGLDGKSACSAADTGSILGSGRSPGVANGSPLQDSCLGNPMDRVA